MEQKNRIGRYIDEQQDRECGSALIYILIAIALLALLTISFMEPSSKQVGSQNMFKLVTELQSQIEFIRSTVHECILLHQGGDINIPVGGGDDDVKVSLFVYYIDNTTKHYYLPVLNDGSFYINVLSKSVESLVTTHDGILLE